MSRKRRSISLDFSVYLAVRIGVSLIQALPFALACRFAEILAWLLYHLDRRHRQVALDNLRHAFPNEYTDAELDKLTRKVFRHFCLMIMEILFFAAPGKPRQLAGIFELPQHGGSQQGRRSLDRRPPGAYGDRTLR